MFDANFFRFDPQTAEIEGRGKIIRRLSDLSISFADREAYQSALRAGDPVLYHTSQVEDETGDGDLHYALGVLLPGKIGDEYYLTKGHIHSWRPAAEIYIGISGRGMMLLEDETTGECAAFPLEENTIVYVPGNVSHRTINVGDEPLVYWGILSSRAGHDYGAVAQRNFRKVIVERNGAPVVLDRSDYLAQLHQSSTNE
jgi:glucose-6-phosphate isomerase